MDKAIDKVDDYTTPITEYIEPLQPAINTATSYLSTGFKIWGHFQRWRYNAFLKGFARKTCEDLDLEKYREKMGKLSSNKKFMDFLYQTMFEAMNAKSNRASTIMGMYVAEIISTSKNITYEVLLLINALKELNDWDIYRFIEIVSFLDKKKNKGDTSASISQIFYKREEEMNDDVDLSSSIELAEYKATIDKFIKLQILSTAHARAADYETYSVSLTYFSYTLMDMFKRYKIY